VKGSSEFLTRSDDCIFSMACCLLWLDAKYRNSNFKDRCGCLAAYFVSRLGSAMRPREVNRILARAGNLADVKHPDPNRESINPHLLRHTFANNWKKQRGDYEALQQILGHASIATTVDSYGRLSVDDIQAHYRQLMDQG